MKRIILILLICVSCSTQTIRHPASVSSNDPLIQKYEADIVNFQISVEEALVWRAKSVEFYNLHEDELKQKNQLSHQAMLEIFESTKQFLGIREKIYDVVKKYQFGNSTSLRFVPGQGTKIETYTHSVGDEMADENTPTTTVIKIDPTDDQGREILLRLKLGLSAATVLYDSYMIGIYPYEKHRKTRRLINLDNPEYKLALDKITDNFFNLNNRLQFLAATRIFKKSEEYDQAKKRNLSNEEKYLGLLISQSPVFQFMETGRKIEEQPNVIRTFADRIYDSGRFLVESFSYFTSMAFGNTMGLIQFRDGKLKSLSENEKNEVKSLMRPLDIMMEKTPFRLTDRFIPGYYGHVAIWIGTKEELIQLGVWDDPLIAKYHDQIEKGHSIIEALRPGVQINTFDHFLDIDDLLIVRDKNLTDDERKEFIIRAFSQIGKEYDFNFDVETDNKIVCSELAYVVFHDIQWPTEKSMGRYTISPDNVAVKAIHNGPLAPIVIYRSGERQQGDLEAVLEDILK
jgi:hypothetical protein